MVEERGLKMEMFCELVTMARVPPNKKNRLRWFRHRQSRVETSGKR